MKKNIHRLVGILLIIFSSCSPEGVTTGAHTAYTLVFKVTSAQSRAAADDETEDTYAEENRIRSLYIYAFDGNYTNPDYYAEPAVNDGQGAIGDYSVRMDIYDEGTKRFYVIANPPAYIETQLIPACTEQRLKALTLQLQRPVYTVSQLPQNMDGLTQAGDKGFPMCNVMTARAQLSDDASRQMRLLPQETEGEVASRPIQSLPLIRALGKITVSAYLLPGNQTPVTVTDLKLFNYTGNGSFLPVWESDNDWMAGSDDRAVWNSAKKLDLEAHALQETKLQTGAVSVFGYDLPGDASHPGYIDDTYNEKENARTITAFYLCQNSYGEKSITDEQDGLVDAIGNRTTHLVVSLSDGRNSEIPLPYLRRNDRLAIRLGISQYAIKFDFQLWTLSSVEPDWSEEVLPSE